MPGASELEEGLHGVFGITVDARGWLWLVRPGAMAGRPTEFLVFNPDTGAFRIEFEFP